MTFRAAILMAAALVMAGCYRPAPPDALGETVRLEFSGNDGRFVRAQGYLAEELGKNLATRLGWQVSPTGTATLTISLREERINVSGRSRDGIPEGQRVRLRGTALLSARGSALTTPFSGEAVVTSIGTEPESLRAAAQACAQEIGAWLSVRTHTLDHPAP